MDCGMMAPPPSLCVAEIIAQFAAYEFVTAARPGLLGGVQEALVRMIMKVQVAEPGHRTVRA